MSQAYSDPKRASDPHALPDVEVFHHPRHYQLNEEGAGTGFAGDEYGVDYYPSGWYWWHCFPGCPPDGDPVGPFDSEAEALADAQDQD